MLNTKLTLALDAQRQSEGMEKDIPCKWKSKEINTHNR